MANRAHLAAKVNETRMQRNKFMEICKVLISKASNSVNQMKYGWWVLFLSSAVVENFG